MKNSCVLKRQYHRLPSSELPTGNQIQNEKRLFEQDEEIFVLQMSQYLFSFCVDVCLATKNGIRLN